MPLWAHMAKEQSHVAALVRDGERARTPRVEITTAYAKSYKAASKKDRGRMLDELVAATGWSRDNARRQLTAAATTRSANVGSQIAGTRPRQRADRYSTDARQVLPLVWTASGGQCGKYLVESMGLLLNNLEAHGELIDGVDRYSPAVRAELMAMSAATIDRYLKAVRDCDKLHRIRSATSSRTRSSMTIRRTGEEIEVEPGFFQGDTIPHCGPTLFGEYVRTVHLSCVCTGWVFTRTVRHNTHISILRALQVAVEQIPFAVVDLGFDNGSEFYRYEMGGSGDKHQIQVTRSKDVNESAPAQIASRNGHLVFNYGFRYRYDTPAELHALNRLWPLVNDQLNFFTPAKRPTGWTVNRSGRRCRIYDKPATPLDRLLAAGVLSPAQQADLIAKRDSLNPAELTRRIHDEQQTLIKPANARPPTSAPALRTSASRSSPR